MSTLSLIHICLGVCRVDGCAVFVPNAAPDEEYDLRITHVGRHAAYGRIEQMCIRDRGNISLSLQKEIAQKFTSAQSSQKEIIEKLDALISQKITI